MRFALSHILSIVSFVSLAAAGCGGTTTSHAPVTDAGPAGVDAGPVDAGPTVDAGVDAGSVDAGVDAGPLDAGIDAGVDAGPVDAGVDAGTVDAGVDAGTIDAGTPDAGGGCQSNAECPAAEPICSLSTNTCAAPAVTVPSTFTYSALIVTNEALAPAFAQLAQIHTLTGVPTQLVTVEDICAADPTGCDDSNPCSDTPVAIKNYLVAQQALGVQQVLIGGGVDAVPSRQTSDSFSFSSPIYNVSYAETFYTDYYYADFSNWDTNDNCIYGEPGVDMATYLPTIGVTRVASSDATELQGYFAKVLAYLTAYDTSRIQSALFISNIAAQFMVPSDIPIVGGDTINVDSALYFEAPGRTVSLIPSDYDIFKLYSTLPSLPFPVADAQQLSVSAETTALEMSYGLVVHAGHGDETDLTVEMDGSNEFSGAMAASIQNTQYPIMISTACEAGTFADGDGCAGEQFVMNASGGGIGYLGNSTIGLGIAGGAQFLDQFVTYTFQTPSPLASEVVMNAHQHEPTSDTVTLDLPVVGNESISAITPDSWRWTQKAVAYLGDGLLPIWTDGSVTTAPAFSVNSQQIGNFTQLTFTPVAAVAGTLAVAIGSDVYLLPTDGSGSAVSITVSGAPSQIAYGFSSMTTLDAYQSMSLP